ncbi:hypothetical protein G7Y89_g1202 [Cudoniella acicularis]|uniref:Peptidase S28 n=1 Tax=Cudoniella acicularis TaxID=354080 RepID=A0A8H4W9R8_9HELO|nr:hypothetical protein G7Y89_g1202 [Cudoniella acicularis]
MLSFKFFLLTTTLCISHVQGKYNLKVKKLGTSPTLPVSYVDMPLDHFTTNPTTFQNRYFVNDAYYKPGGPVIFFDGGESGVDGLISYLIDENGKADGAFTSLAKQFNGLLILWEHRYFGESYPAPRPTNQTDKGDSLGEYYKYLTTEQALEDVAVFAKNFTLASQPNQNLRPSSVPWIMVGASYPGVRSAWMRLRNPEVIFASLSSSAPVQLTVDFWEYYVAIERALVDYGYGSCLTDLHAFASQLSNGANQRNVTMIENFLAIATQNTDGYVPSRANTDDAWNNRTYLLQSTYETFMPGRFQVSERLLPNCRDLTSQNYTNDTSATAADFNDGIVAAFGIDYATEVFAQVVHDNNFEINANFSSDTTTYDYAAADIYSWQYLTCMEFGFWQVANMSRPTNIALGLNNASDIAWNMASCNTSFGATSSSGPNTTALLTKYKGWSMNPTNILSINGKYDPWRALSVASTVDASTPNRNLTTAIPTANSPSPNGEIFGMVIANGSHANDFWYNATFMTDTAQNKDIIAAHNLFESALSSWLPAYTTFVPAPTSAPTAAAAATATATQTKKSAAGRTNVKLGSLIAGLLAVLVLSI